MTDQDAPAFDARVRRFLNENFHFDVKEIIGSGAFGSVARAEFGKPKKVCAIKLMHRTANESKNRLVRREIASLAKVDHPNCCTLAQVVVLMDLYGLVMEYCPGGTLGSYLLKLKRNEFVPPEFAALWCSQLTSVVHSLHHLYQLVHRDIKPDNIFFDAHYHVKLGDFGFAKDNTTDLRHTKCGSELFAPPEMHRPKGKDGGLVYSPTKMDVWGVGLIIHLVYTNRLPYTMAQLEKPLDTLPRITEQLKKFEDLIPAEVWNVLVGALEPDPKRRATMCSLWLDPWFYAKRLEEKGGLHPL